VSTLIVLALLFLIFFTRTGRKVVFALLVVVAETEVAMTPC
jgi:hypothetical protein